MAVVRIPVGEWERRADVPFGMWAPELNASRLLDITEVGAPVGVSPATITAYLSRRRMPSRSCAWDAYRCGPADHPAVADRPAGTGAAKRRIGRRRKPARRSDTLTTSDPGMVGPARAI